MNAVLFILGALLLAGSVTLLFAMAQEAMDERKFHGMTELERKLWRSGGIVKGQPQEKELN
jgi:predicted outer membrane lipoprotein